jgi:hypothetical protein
VARFAEQSSAVPEAAEPQDEPQSEPTAERSPKLPEAWLPLEPVPLAAVPLDALAASLWATM